LSRHEQVKNVPFDSTILFQINRKTKWLNHAAASPFTKETPTSSLTDPAQFNIYE